MISGHVLVLNRSFLPIHITSIRHAICLLYRGLAKVVDEQYELFDYKSWSELSVQVESEKIGLVSKSIRLPRVIILHMYDRVPRKSVRFSRLNIYLRDENTCQYCGKHFNRSELNLDHVIPVSKGGQTTWENVVCSCIPCNINKGGRTPQEAGIKLLKTPVRPHWSLFFRMQSHASFCSQWQPFLSLNTNTTDFTYWNLELKKD